MDISKIKVLSSQPRVSFIPNPENGGNLETVTNDVAITVRPSNIFYGGVKFKEVDGVNQLDTSNLHDLTPNEIDLPAGVEVVIMACNLEFPLLPVKFIHPDSGSQYRAVWIESKNLHYVAGNQGLHLNGSN